MTRRNISEHRQSNTEPEHDLVADFGAWADRSVYLRNEAHPDTNENSACYEKRIIITQSCRSHRSESRGDSGGDDIGEQMQGTLGSGIALHNLYDKYHKRITRGSTSNQLQY